MQLLNYVGNPSTADKNEIHEVSSTDAALSKCPSFLRIFTSLR